VRAGHDEQTYSKGPQGASPISRGPVWRLVFVGAREVRTSVIRADHIKIWEHHPVVEGDASLAVAEAAWAGRELRVVSVVLPLTVKAAGAEGRAHGSRRVVQHPCRDAVQLLVTCVHSANAG
jgi:hypothetical protein